MLVMRYGGGFTVGCRSPHENLAESQDGRRAAVPAVACSTSRLGGGPCGGARRAAQRAGIAGCSVVATMR